MGEAYYIYNLNVFIMADVQKLNVNNTTYDISTTWSKVTGKPSTFPPESHTHSYLPLSGGTMSNQNVVVNLNADLLDGYSGSAYAKKTDLSSYIHSGNIGSQSVNYANSVGSATTATKLSSDAGSATNPIYFSGGKPVACTYSLNKTVPANAVFTDTNTWRPVTNTYTGSDQSTCVSQYGTNALYNALVNGYASSAGSASLLTKQGGTSTATSVWNPLTSYKKVWGQNFTDTSLTSDTGDILYYLRKASSSSTELCVCIDGDYYAMGGMSSPQKVLHAGNSSVSKSGQTLSVTINGVTQSLTNTDTNTDTWMGNGIWAPNTNVKLDASSNGQEWSFDISRNGYSNCYWHVWDSSLGSLLTVYPDSGNVTVLGRCTASGFYQGSDERLKTFYDPIKVDLEKLKTLRKNYFKFNDRDKLEIGVSAQEIQSLYPEIVSTNDKGYLSVAYDKLSVIALAAIDELDNINNKQQKEIDDLKDQLKAIKNILNEKGIL